MTQVARTWEEITIVARQVLGPVSVRTVQRLHARYDLRVQQFSERSRVFVAVPTLEARLLELLRIPRAGQRSRCA